MLNVQAYAFNMFNDSQRLAFSFVVIIIPKIFDSMIIEVRKIFEIQDLLNIATRIWYYPFADDLSMTSPPSSYCRYQHSSDNG